MSAPEPRALSRGAQLDPGAAERFSECIRAGGVAVFPADTVYGLACDPCNAEAVRRLYELKGRPPAQPAAVMFFALAPALAALPELEPRTRHALMRLLPGPLTVLLPNPADRFPLACRPAEGLADGGVLTGGDAPGGGAPGGGAPGGGASGGGASGGGASGGGASGGGASGGGASGGGASGGGASGGGASGGGASGGGASGGDAPGGEAVVAGKASLAEDAALGLRVPLLAPAIAVLGAVAEPVLQSSANLSGGSEARRLSEVAPAIREGADLVLDGGELPGVASTVLDLRDYERGGDWTVVRSGPLGPDELRRRLG